MSEKQNKFQPAQMYLFTRANYSTRSVFICGDSPFLKLLPRQSNAVALRATRPCSEGTERREEE